MIRNGCLPGSYFIAKLEKKELIMYNVIGSSCDCAAQRRKHTECQPSKGIVFITGDRKRDKMTNDLKDFLCNLVSRIKTYSYDFDLELTRYSETESDTDRRTILECVDELLKAGNTDAAFAGLYLFTIYLKNDNNTKGLETVVTSYERYFDDEKYPLVLELKSRYLKRKNKDLDAWKKALECDKRALELLHGRYFAKSTYGLNASYVSTLCRILEYGANNKETLEAIRSFISTEDVEFGLQCISENIRNIGSYAKNYYLKAQLMYYDMVVFRDEPEREIKAVEKRCEACDEMIAELSKAIEAEEFPAKCETYRSLAETIIAYQSSLAASVSAEWNEQLQQADSFDSCNSPMCHAKLSGRKYAYICYSRTDYKRVFQDLYWLYCNGISIEYDRIVKSGSKWSASVKEAMLDNDCAVVVFFLSGSVFTSDSLYKEITMVRASSKSYFFISVTGETTSRMLYDLYNKEPYEPLFKNTLTSDRLSQVISFFNDSIHYISRTENEYERKLAGDIKHFFRGQRELLHETGDVSAKVELLAGTFTAPNGRVFDGIKKPNEDYLICDEKQGIFIVADGVTRPHSEYARRETSPAYEVSRIFCKSVYRKVKAGILRCASGHEVERLMSDAFAEGNAEVAQWNENWVSANQPSRLYKPATVVICAVIYKNTLFFSYIGDCIGILIRNQCRFVFAERQTRAVSKLKVNKEQLYLHYVNNPNQKYSYGIINGDLLACTKAVHSHLALESGDRIILSTDGLANMLLSESPQILASNNLISIIPSLSGAYDVPPFAEYGDDKALIEIMVNSIS